MNTTLSIRVEESLKKSFLETAKSRGIDWSVLIRLFMQKISQNPNMLKIDFDSEFDELFSNKSVVKKLNKLSDKLDNLWF